MGIGRGYADSYNDIFINIMSGVPDIILQVRLSSRTTAGDLKKHRKYGG